jgi:chemotaxis protein CheX
VQDDAGVIGISGNREGKVYFTAPRGMLSVMLMCMNETDTGEQNVRDLVGEVANTISGNARRDFGRNFIISTPTICDRTNAATAAATTGRSFVIPINWRSYAANVVVCLQ